VNWVEGMISFIAAFFAFFLPGFIWSHVLVPGKRLSLLERGVLSVGLSVALVAISGLVLNFFLDIEVSGVLNWGTILTICVLGLAIVLIRSPEIAIAFKRRALSLLAHLRSVPGDEDDQR
jgi:uncharacterized membrane protein